MFYRFFNLVILALRYLYRNRRRYLFLLAALSFGFGVVTVITSLKDGMDHSVYRAAQSHYAGDIVVAGYDNDSKTQFRTTEAELILEAVSAARLDPSLIVRRTMLGGKGILYFNGTPVRQKYILGVDWENEKEYLQGLPYTKEGFIFPEEPGGIIISLTSSREMGARLGDRVILEVETRTGQKNTGSFTVMGVVRDSGIFGTFKSYIALDELNRLMSFGPGDCSSVGIFLKETGNLEEKTRRLQEELEKRVPMGPLVSDRDELARESKEKWDGIRHFIVTIPVYLSEVAELLTALEVIAYFLYAMMLLIILVSVSVTYRLILHERLLELGTMRVLGFFESDLRQVLILELFFLCVVSLFVGFAAARLAAWGISFMSFSYIPSFEIFMSEGRLKALFLFRTTLVNVAAVMGVLLPVVWFPAFRTSRGSLPEMLSGGNL